MIEQLEAWSPEKGTEVTVSDEALHRTYARRFTWDRYTLKSKGCKKIRVIHVKIKRPWF